MCMREQGLKVGPAWTRITWKFVPPMELWSGVGETPKWGQNAWIKRVGGAQVLAIYA